jgi:hypothetical protein
MYTQEIIFWPLRTCKLELSIYGILIWSFYVKKKKKKKKHHPPPPPGGGGASAPAAPCDYASEFNISDTGDDGLVVEPSTREPEGHEV